jgi:leucyl/phenylalanyl-tRNA--protein transferase
MYFISSFFFPPVSEANKDGILAIGGDLTWHDLQLAYKVVFMWFEDYEPIIWWSPNSYFDELIVSKSMRKEYFEQKYF